MDPKIEKSLKYSLKDAAFWAIMAGSGESYISAFGIFLKATALQISLLASLPQLVGSSLQLFAARLMNIFKSRKKAVLLSATLQAFVWPIFIAYGFYFKNVWILIFIVILYFSFAMLGGPAWTSWMGDLVSKEKRGTFFAKRAKITSIVVFLSSVTAGLILNYFDKINGAMGFAIIFSIAFIGRLSSLFFLFMKHEPEPEKNHVVKTSFKKFIKELKHSNFGVFTFFTTMMIFSVNISGPFFVIFWLNYLQFSYLQYMIIIATEQLVTFLVIVKWGEHIDLFGNKTILFVSSFFITTIPLAWFMIQFIPFVFIFAIFLQMLAGFAWAGFNLSAANYIYDSVEPSERISLFSYYIMLRSLALFLGSMIGPFLMKFKLGFANPFFFVLLVSFIFRAITFIWFSSKLGDVKTTHKNKFLYFASAVPLRGVKLDVIFGLNRKIKNIPQKIFKKKIN